MQLKSQEPHINYFERFFQINIGSDDAEVLR